MPPVPRYGHGGRESRVDLAAQFVQPGRQLASLQGLFRDFARVAEDLSKGFGFVRVDLYAVADKVYFGELTPYPVGVSKFYSFDIDVLDVPLGDKWTGSLLAI